MRRIAPNILEDGTMRIERVGRRGWATSMRLAEHGADLDVQTGYLVGHPEGPMLAVGDFPTRRAAEAARDALFAGAFAFRASGSGGDAIVPIREAESALASARPAPRGRFPFAPF